MTFFAQGTLKYLATLAVACSCGLADPAPSLLRVPQEVLLDVVEEVDKRQGQPADRKRLLDLLALDPRASVRGFVVKQASRVWRDAPEDALELLRSLASDDSYRVRLEVAAALGQLLQQASPLARIDVVVGWALADAAHERAAIALALRQPVPIAVADLAIEHLAQDRSCFVRRLATEAAGRRFRESPGVHTKTLTRLTGDPIEAVRWRARQLLEENTRDAGGGPDGGLA